MCFCPQTGATALHMAAQKGKVEVVRLLIEAKALVNIQKKVYTSLSHMTEKSYKEIYVTKLVTVHVDMYIQ